MTESNLTDSVSRALSALPDSRGGRAIIMATGVGPPAIAVLSTGDVLLVGEDVRVGVHASSSVVRRLGEGFSLLIPLEDVGVRVEAVEATAHVGRSLALVQGRIQQMRPTAEPPWALEMSFLPHPPDDDRIDLYVDYWRHVREWLAGRSPEPALPFTG